MKNLFVRLKPIIKNKDRLKPIIKNEDFETMHFPETCMAVDLSSRLEWEKNKLQIKWNSIEKYFEVIFEGESKENLSLNLRSVLSTKIPIEIANSSKCNCGSVLRLGNYSITLENDKDFAFHANYYCPKCKMVAQAKTKGFKNIIMNWIHGLKKIEIKTSGISLEKR